MPRGCACPNRRQVVRALPARAAYCGSAGFFSGSAPAPGVGWAGKAAVWKSSDGGQSWAGKRDGLPQTSCYFTVLRQAMAGDMREPAGVYFGTNSGSVFASTDEGETWQEAARHLPTVLAVEVLDTAAD